MAFPDVLKFYLNPLEDENDKLDFQNCYHDCMEDISISLLGVGISEEKDQNDQINTVLRHNNRGIISIHERKFLDTKPQIVVKDIAVLRIYVGNFLASCFYDFDYVFSLFNDIISPLYDNFEFVGFENIYKDDYPYDAQIHTDSAYRLVNSLTSVIFENSNQ